MPQFTTNNPKETRALAARFARTVRGGEMIGFRGPLGAGKTEFIRGILSALGIKEPVTSPTFVLSKTYHPIHQKIRHVIHVDAYRLEKPEEVYGTETLDYWGRPDSLVCIEWPERLAGIVPPTLENIIIDRGKENVRYWFFEQSRARRMSGKPKPRTSRTR